LGKREYRTGHGERGECVTKFRCVCFHGFTLFNETFEDPGCLTCFRFTNQNSKTEYTGLRIKSRIFGDIMKKFTHVINSPPPRKLTDH
ncbi:MAG: hypothetical protein J6J31_10725, partial [Thermoguttaceae bacterium]|nr:hypothetical protein [Thermoguttaceae bacterium]